MVLSRFSRMMVVSVVELRRRFNEAPAASIFPWETSQAGLSGIMKAEIIAKPPNANCDRRGT
jgi:hypothetical protein